MLKDELALILDAVPGHAGYVTLPCKFLVKLYAEICEESKAQQADKRMGIVAQYLTQSEYLLLKKMLEQSERTVSPGALVSAANITSVESLWVHITRLRKKLARRRPDLKIKTITGVGYLLTEKELR